MTREDIEKTFMLAHVNLKDDFDSLDDLPYELANAVANIYWRHFEQGHFSSILQSEEEWTMREKEYRTVKLVIQDYRVMREGGAHQSILDYTVGYLLDILRHRIPNANNKLPIWRRMQRLVYPHRDQPDLARSLKLYRHE